MILELQRTKRVGDALDRIRKAVGEVVHRIDRPLVARAVVVNPADPNHDRISKVQVRRLHVDLRAQYVRAVFANSPARIRWKRSRFSSIERSRCGLSVPGS